MSESSPLSPQRRSFLTFLNSRAAAVAALAAGGAAIATGKQPARWQPARHEKDDWLDKLPGKHRIVFDTTTVNAFGEALAFAGNFMRANHTDYGLEDSDLAVVIVARHHSTPFAYSDAIWAKYGAPIATQAGFEDPKTKQPPAVNPYNSAEYARVLNNRGTTVDSLLKRGVQLAVCNTATRVFAGVVAAKVGASSDTIFAELTTNLLSNSRMVPAGIVAVSRAQERGYTLVTT